MTVALSGLGAAGSEIRLPALRRLRRAADWPDGSRLVGDYTVGPPADHIEFHDGRVTLTVDRRQG